MSRRLKRQSARQGHQQLWQAAGGYAAVYPGFSAEQGIAVTTDGVGTKLLVAEQLRRYDTVVIVVAMCANDLICVGAKPTLFLDYFAVGKLERYADDIIKGIVAGCDQARDDLSRW